MWRRHERPKPRARRYSTGSSSCRRPLLRRLLSPARRRHRRSHRRRYLRLQFQPTIRMTIGRHHPVELPIARRSSSSRSRNRQISRCRRRASSSARRRCRNHSNHLVWWVRLRPTSCILARSLRPVPRHPAAWQCQGWLCRLLSRHQGNSQSWCIQGNLRRRLQIRVKPDCFNRQAFFQSLMSLLDEIQIALTDAMRKQARTRLSALRMLKTALTNREVEKGRPLDDHEARQVVTSLVKQRRDSIEQFARGGRQDLVDKETAEISVLEAYLPAATDSAVVEQAIADAIRETQAASVKDMGRVMKAVMTKLAGQQVDGKMVSDLVRQRLTG
ncbi:MAG: hypothetical protein C5B57_04930 [Blastocatellia bacterium]|nr:MAG: hypothetical protein C5B57_04930 [Blastocatellia bacterium]